MALAYLVEKKAKFKFNFLRMKFQNSFSEVVTFCLSCIGVAGADNFQL